MPSGSDNSTKNLKKENNFDTDSDENYTPEKKKDSNKCKICHKSFTRGKSLKRHITSIHEGIKPFKCDTCEVSFGQKSNLDRHIAFAHEGWNVQNCGISSTIF